MAEQAQEGSRVGRGLGGLGFAVGEELEKLLYWRACGLFCPFCPEVMDYAGKGPADGADVWTCSFCGAELRLPAGTEGKFRGLR